MKIVICVIAINLLICGLYSKKSFTNVLPIGAPFTLRNPKLFEPCFKDAQCENMKKGESDGVTLLCDTAIMECRSKSRCGKDKECFHKHVCENSFCKSKDVCQSTPDCVASRVCVDGKCKLTGVTCHDDRICPMGQYCNSGICTTLLPQPCEIDGNCNPGSLCFNGKCIRNKNKKCVADAHCKNGWRCHNQRCKKRCEAPNDCPTNMACDKELNICKKPSPFGCILDSDCPIGHKCRSGKCKDTNPKIGCNSVSDCKKNQVCQKHYCLSLKGGKCKDYKDCVAPLKCSPAHICYSQKAMDEKGLILKKNKK